MGEIHHFRSVIKPRQRRNNWLSSSKQLRSPARESNLIWIKRLIRAIRPSIRMLAYGLKRACHGHRKRILPGIIKKMRESCEAYNFDKDYNRLSGQLSAKSPSFASLDCRMYVG